MRSLRLGKIFPGCPALTVLESTVTLSKTVPLTVEYTVKNRGCGGARGGEHQVNGAGGSTR
jgi:hypothetical protein